MADTGQETVAAWGAKVLENGYCYDTPFALLRQHCEKSRISRPRKRIWFPRGITFPWFADGQLWRLNTRRPLTPAQIADGRPKYLGPPGFANGQYNADALAGDPACAKPAVLCGLR